jgi:ribosome-binding protein aMBF1 (putative translation factor)
MTWVCEFCGVKAEKIRCVIVDEAALPLCSKCHDKVLRVIGQLWVLRDGSLCDPKHDTSYKRYHEVTIEHYVMYFCHTCYDKLIDEARVKQNGRAV